MPRPTLDVEWRGRPVHNRAGKAAIAGLLTVVALALAGLAVMLGAGIVLVAGCLVLFVLPLLPLLHLGLRAAGRRGLLVHDADGMASVRVDREAFARSA